MINIINRCSHFKCPIYDKCKIGCTNLYTLYSWTLYSCMYILCAFNPSSQYIYKKVDAKCMYLHLRPTYKNKQSGNQRCLHI